MKFGLQFSVMVQFIVIIYTCICMYIHKIMKRTKTLTLLSVTLQWWSVWWCISDI